MLVAHTGSSQAGRQPSMAPKSASAVCKLAATPMSSQVLLRIAAGIVSSQVLLCIVSPQVLIHIVAVAARL